MLSSISFLCDSLPFIGSLPLPTIDRRCRNLALSALGLFVVVYVAWRWCTAIESSTPKKKEETQGRPKRTQDPHKGKLPDTDTPSPPVTGTGSTASRVPTTPIIIPTPTQDPHKGKLPGTATPPLPVAGASSIASRVPPAPISPTPTSWGGVEYSPEKLCKAVSWDIITKELGSTYVLGGQEGTMVEIIQAILCKAGKQNVADMLIPTLAPEEVHRIVFENTGKSICVLIVTPKAMKDLDKDDDLEISAIYDSRAVVIPMRCKKEPAEVHQEQVVLENATSKAEAKRHAAIDSLLSWTKKTLAENISQGTINLQTLRTDDFLLNRQEGINDKMCRHYFQHTSYDVCPGLATKESYRLAYVQGQYRAIYPKEQE